MSFAAKLTGVWGIGMALMLGFSMAAADGRLIFALDDVYIHLAIAENILRGTYGVNLGDPASASSSVLYPLLLAGTQAIGLGYWGPLPLVLLGSGLSVWLLGDIIARVIPEPTLRWLLALIGLFALSAFALPMTGLEHSLHVLACLAALRGLIRLSGGARPGGATTLAVVTLPLLRFEGIAMAALMILVQIWQGHWRAALAQTVLIGVALATYASVMQSLGLPPLPSSVTTKSAVATSVTDGGGLIDALLITLRASLSHTPGVVIAVMLALVVALWLAGGGRDLGMAAVVGGTLAAHLIGGKIGWFGRYEVYAIATGTVGILWLARHWLAAPKAVVKLGALAGLTVAVLPYAQVTALTPAASRNVHDQQLQLARFVDEFYSAPVAVNDLGLVSYRNDLFVLDLWGLGSEEVRQLRADGALDAATMARLTDAAGVEVVMIYEDWFPTLPDSWIRLATMRTTRVSAGRETVSVFATPLADKEALNTALVRFAETLPERVGFEME